ncbi:YhgE/Pip domain-containing protein [Nocardia concava]|uniref:YhgE/Pip domain-containing protein n=1 Tax=Nocardia concava TaxID=257281 RepID=UPI001FE23368|nr:ABC transporter permease [Nocardia concava]
MPTTEGARGQQQVTPRKHLTPLRFLFPVLIVTFLAAVLGVMYLDYIVDPQQNLHDFPIALVNRDEGDIQGRPGQEKRVNFGDQVAEGLRKAVPADQIDLRVLGVNEAELQMQNAQIYGAVIIPGDFSKRLGILGVGSIVPGDIQLPTITLQTNPRTGIFATTAVELFGEKALDQVNKQVGEQLLATVRAQLAPPPGDSAPAPAISGTTQIALERPLNIVVDQFDPLPTGSGQGLTAFFYALLLLIAGMVGAMIIHTLIDSALGFLPTEWGPWYLRPETASITRFHTLLLKWSAVAAMSVVVSIALMIVANCLGMPIDDPLQLFLYGTLVILAVGVTSISILAAIGWAGLIVNVIIFVILGVPSSGGTVPLEATPKYFGWLSSFEPMHQVFLGVRSILYFNGSAQAGLSRGVWMSILGLAIGIVLGIVATRAYDRRGLDRAVRTPERQAAPAN